MTHTFFTKRIFFMQLLAVAATIALSACDATQTDLNDAQKLTDTLGVPVFLWASQEDVCAQKQFHRFLDQFNSASEAERSIFLGDVKKYDAVIFIASQVVAPITGRYTKLELVDSNGAVTASHDFVDTRVFSELRGTSVHKTNHLVVSPQSAPDHSDTKIYATSNGDLYALIISGGQNYLDDAVAAAKLQDVTALGPNPVNCGRLVDLKDLL